MPKVPNFRFNPLLENDLVALALDDDLSMIILIPLIRWPSKSIERARPPSSFQAVDSVQIAEPRFNKQIQTGRLAELLWADCAAT